MTDTPIAPEGLIARMKWVTTAPTKPGWYWHRWSGITTMECVIALGERLVVDHRHHIPVDRFYDNHGEWAGPIPEPTDAQCAQTQPSETNRG